MRCRGATNHDFRTASYLCVICGYRFTQEMVDDDLYGMAIVRGAFSQLLNPGLARAIYPGAAYFLDDEEELLAWIKAQEDMPIIYPDTSKIPIWRRRPTRKEGPITAWRVWELGLNGFQTRDTTHAWWSAKWDAEHRDKDRGWVLCSVAARTEWDGPVLKADCAPIDPKLWDEDKSKTTHVFRTAGIHAVKTREQCTNLMSLYGAQVFGELKLWGRVAQFELGYRAEYCMITKLFIVEKAIREFRRREKEIVHDLEKRYQCEVEVV